MPEFPESKTTPMPRGTGGFLHPERTLAELEIRPGMVVADFGCGGGYFSIPAARLVGEGGKVFAVDVQKQAVDHVRSRANLDHLLNVETVWADLETPKGSRLHDAAADLVIIANILFQAEVISCNAHSIAHSLVILHKGRKNLGCICKSCK